MNRFSLKIFKKVWQLVKPYWFGNQKWGAIGILIVSLLLTLIYAFLQASIASFQGDLLTTLTQKDRQGFFRTIWMFLIVLGLYVPVTALATYLQEKLSNYWRKWMTHDFLNRYFSNLSFYQLGNFKTSIDNPDQRIAEDIKSFTSEALNFFLIIFNAVVQGIFSIALIWKIPPRVVIYKFSEPIVITFSEKLKLTITQIAPSILVVFLLAYLIIGTLITIGVFGRKLVSINYKQLKKEADFRFGLVRIRENSESIAFYQGERQEAHNLKLFFEQVFKNYNSLIFWRSLLLKLFTGAYDNIPLVLPAVVIAPSVLSGAIGVGKIRVAQIAFAQFFLAINIVVSRFEYWTAFVAGIDRLYTFKGYLDKNNYQKYQQKSAKPTINFIQRANVALDRVTLQTPNYSRTLVQDLSFNLPPGESLLIKGVSGCGKSSLLRAIASLWDSGTGTIYRPKLSEMLFLPQKPYMILGSLRSQLIYPRSNSNPSDLELNAALYKVNLPNLVERVGGLDAENDWDDLLSLGEQQRLAFARIMLNQPQYVILDEATSALDINNEAKLYQYLQELHITFVSVGHRPTLVQYHTQVLEMSEDETWNLRTRKIG